MSLLSSLEKYDRLLRNPNNETRTRHGNLEVISNHTIDDNEQGSNHEEIAICNLAALIPFRMEMPGMEPRFLTDLYSTVATQLALAVQHLNTGNGSIVRDLEGLSERCNIRFTLELLDSGLMENVAVNEVIRVTDRHAKGGMPVCAFQGASRSPVSMATATITGLRGYPQISAASTSPTLSSNADAPLLYPLFGRTIPSDDAIAVPIVEYFQTLNVEHVAVLYVNDPYGTAFARGLHEAAAVYPHLKLKTVEIAPIVDENGQDESNVQRAVREVKATQFQYIFAIINNNVLFEKVILQAYQEGIAGTGQHTWMFSDAGLGPILEAKPQQDSPLHAALLGTGVLMASAGLTEHIPNLNTYFESLNTLAKSKADMDYLLSKAPHPEAFPPDTDLTQSLAFDSNDPYAPFIYDSIVALGLGACNAAASTVEPETYFTGPEHFDAITRTTFVGTSGPVVLNPETGTREPSSAYYGLYQVHDTITEDGNNTVKFHVTISSLFDHGDWSELKPYVYADGTAGIPLPDLPDVTLKPNHLGTGWRVAGWILCGLGIALAAGLALWTYQKKKEKNRVVVASQPFFLYLICFGMATFFASIIPLGVDEQIASSEGCTIACNSVLWLLATGFCITFSAMFTKTHRVNKIFKSPGFTRIKVTPLDVAKPMMVCLGTNFLLLVLMSVIKPIEWIVEVLEEDIFERPIETRGFCDWSDSISFVIPLAAINLGCLVYALIQAYEARGISIEFAESEYIFRCMVVITLKFFVAFPVLLLIRENNNAFFFFFSATIAITGTLVLLLMFLPKISYIAKREKQREDRVRISIAGGASTPFSTSAFFGSTSNGSSTTSEEGLLILSHPKTESELRERVAALEGRLRKFSEQCTCGQQGSDKGSEVLPLNVPEQASHARPPSTSFAEEDQKAATCSNAKTTEITNGNADGAN